MEVANGPLDSMYNQMSVESPLMTSAASTTGTTLSNSSASADKADAIDPSLVVDGQFLNNIKVFNHLHKQINRD